MAELSVAEIRKLLEWSERHAAIYSESRFDLEGSDFVYSYMKSSLASGVALLKAELAEAERRESGQ